MHLHRRHLLNTALAGGVMGALAAANLLEPATDTAATHHHIGAPDVPRALGQSSLPPFRRVERLRPVPWGRLVNESDRTDLLTLPPGSQGGDGVHRFKGPDGQCYLHPVGTCQLVMSELRHCRGSANPEPLDIARRQADALAKDFEREDDAAFMPHRFPWSFHDVALGLPWRAGMAQGLGVQMMTWLATATSDATYLNHADALFNGFLNPFTTNGMPWVAGVDDNSMLWLDEYPRKEGRLSMVFNGHIVATMGLVRYWEANVNGLPSARVAARPARAAQVQAIIEGALSTANHYKDLCRTPGDASSHVLSRTMAHLKQHTIQIELLDMLSELTGKVSAVSNPPAEHF